MKMNRVFIGARFSRLVVLEKVGPRKWKVRCDCGNEKVIRGGNLLHNTKSCGCWKKESRSHRDTTGVPFGRASRNFKLIEYKFGARSRKLVWALMEEQFDALTSSDCRYCGASPAQRVKSKYRKGDFIYNGIDRVDNSRGYEPDNVVPCCKIC